MTSLPYLMLGMALTLAWWAEKHAGSPQRARWIASAAYIGVFMFVGLRGHLYSDFINYYPYFEDVPQITELSIGTLDRLHFEAGFTIYTSVVKSIWDNYFFWVALGCAIDLWVVRVTFRRYCYSELLPLLFFIAFQGLFIEFNLMRNVKALDCFLLSIPYLQRRQWLRYVALNLLGATFHISSLVYLPLYFILDKLWPAWLRWGGIVFANTIILARISIISALLKGIEALNIAAISDKLTLHTQQSQGEYLLSVGHIERTFAIVLFTILYPKMVEQNRANRIFYALLWLYYLMMLLCYEVRVLADRVPILFVAGYWVLYANVIYLRYYMRQIVATVAVGLALLKLHLSNDIPPARYENLITGIESYEKRRAVMWNFLREER